MLKIRRPLGRLIFNMGIAIPGKTVFLIETAPCMQKCTLNNFENIKNKYMYKYKHYLSRKYCLWNGCLCLGFNMLRYYLYISIKKISIIKTNFITLCYMQKYVCLYMMWVFKRFEFRAPGPVKNLQGPGELQQLGSRVSGVLGIITMQNLWHLPYASTLDNYWKCYDRSLNIVLKTWKCLIFCALPVVVLQ